MKLFFASDIHGAPDACRRMLEQFDASGADRLVLLGDLLYHGPRNALPQAYDTKAVAEQLNARKDVILCVRGNCDAEVDQMVLDFPIMSDYLQLYLGGRRVFATHGHIYDMDGSGMQPPLADGDVFIQGHTHLIRAEKKQQDGKGIYVLNPGSVGIPKGGFPASCGIMDETGFRILDLDGKPIREIRF